MCAGPSRVGRRRCCWKSAAQRYRAGGPGVQRTPGRRPPHRNGGTFGSFSHERTTIIRYVVQKMAAKLSRQLTYKANSAKANKEKSSVSGTGGCGVSRGVSNAGKPASRFGSVSGWARREVTRGLGGAGRSAGPIKKKSACAAGEGAGTPAKCPPPAGPALQPHKTNGAEAPGNAAAFRASAPEENKEHTTRNTRRETKKTT